MSGSKRNQQKKSPLRILKSKYRTISPPTKYAPSILSPDATKRAVLMLLLKL